MINKKSWIKSDKESGDKQCPFGLPIIDGCKNAGSSVSRMCPLKFVSDKQKERVSKANKRVYIYYKDNEPCIYAANIIENLNSVNCNFGDTAQGMHMKALEGSPLYAQTFGLGTEGLYSFPLGMYGGSDESRNLFQGLFSLVGGLYAMNIKKFSYKDLQFLKEIFKKRG